MDALAVCVLIAALALGYTYAGYPLLVGLCARLSGRRPPPAAIGGGPPMISVCLPVWNAAEALPRKLDSLLAQAYPRDRLEILVYCDGCSDGTEDAARAFAARPEVDGRVRVFGSPDRRGKPTGLNALAGAARGDLLLLNDVRQPLSANAAAALAAPFTDPRVGCTTGNLVLTGGAGSGVYWRYENWIRKQESRFRGVVGMTGPIAMMRRADFAPLPEALILDDVWMPMRLALAGKRVVFVEQAEARDAAFDDEREFRRKARTLAGNYQVFALLPALLVPFRNPIWFETVSHKLMRLLAPWLMVALFAASAASALRSAGAQAAVMKAVLAAQAAFYVAAVAGRRGGRVARLARTFVVMNAAAVVGLWRYLAGRQRVTW